jgi:glycosyltransferase involved in cell wall biosynthesis
VVTPTGDRDGLPNVIPEAMAAGTIVLTSFAAATTEAIQSEATGLVADVTRPAEWAAALRRLADDDALAERLRVAARIWVEENYDARRNAERLHAWFAQAAAEGRVQSRESPPAGTRS